MAHPDPWQIRQLESPWKLRLAILHRILSPFGYTAWRDKRRRLGFIVVSYKPMFPSKK